MDNYLLRRSLLFLKLLGYHPKLHSAVTGSFHLICLILKLALIILGVFVNWENIETLGNVSEMIGSLSQIIIKGVVLLKYSREVDKLIIAPFDQFWPTDKFGAALRREVLEVHENLLKMFTKYQTLAFISALMYCVKPLHQEGREYPTRWYGACDASANTCYVVSYAYQTLGICQIYVMVMGYDGVFFSLLSYVYCEMKMIKYAFVNLVDEANLPEDEEITRQRFSDIIEHHNGVLVYIRRLSSMYSPVLLTQFTTSLLNICSAIFLLLAKGFPPTLLQVSRYVPLLLTWNLQVYIYCFAGAKISEQCESVADAAYDSKWWIKYNPKIGKSVPLVIRSSRDRPDITIGNMWKLNMGAFVMVLQKSVSFFTFLQAVYQMEKETN